LRATVRRESKQKRIRERGTSRGLSANYLEPDHEDGSDDENAISLAAIKKKYKQGGKGQLILDIANKK
jgi:RNA polymerase-associated protein LEO1